MRNNPDIMKRYSSTPLKVMRMFLACKKGDEAMSRFLEDTFNADRPENTLLMKSLMAKYHLPPDALLLGEACAQYAETARGEKICIPASSSDEK